LKDEVGEGLPQAELIFGQSQNAYALSAGLLAKHYSLGAEVDQEPQRRFVPTREGAGRNAGLRRSTRARV